MYFYTNVCKCVNQCVNSKSNRIVWIMNQIDPGSGEMNQIDSGSCW